MISDRVSGKCFLNWEAMLLQRGRGHLELGRGLPMSVPSFPHLSGLSGRTTPSEDPVRQGARASEEWGVARTGLGVPPRPPLQGQNRSGPAQSQRVQDRLREHKVTDTNAVPPGADGKPAGQTGSSEWLHGYWGACSSEKAAPQERGQERRVVKGVTTGSYAHTAERAPPPSTRERPLPTQQREAQ